MTRRQLIRHGAWFGAAVVLTVAGGEVISHVAGSAGAAQQATPALRFAQISDSHIGFNGPANPNVTDTFNHAIGQINSLGYTPDFVIHTGDLTHLATPDQFDQVKQMLTSLNTPHVFTVPGEHDSTDDAGQKYRQAFGAGTRGDGWYSFDIAGVHIIGLVNTLNMLEARTSRHRPARVHREGRRVAVQRHPDHGVQPHPTVRDVSRTGGGAPTTPRKP